LDTYENILITKTLSSVLRLLRYDLQIVVFGWAHKLWSAQPTITEKFPGYPREHSLMTDFTFIKFLNMYHCVVM